MIFMIGCTEKGGVINLAKAESAVLGYIRSAAKPTKAVTLAMPHGTPVDLSNAMANYVMFTIPGLTVELRESRSWHAGSMRVTDEQAKG